MKKSHVVRLGALGLLMSFSGFAASGEKGDIKIAVAGPLTGPQAPFGEQLLKGAQQAVNDINAQGGINGRKLVMVEGDDACEPKQAVSVANRLVESDKVKAVIGHFCSSSTIPASEVYGENGTLMITPASTNPTVTDRKIPTIFRMCGRDDQQGVVAADYIMKNLKAKRVAVLHDKDTYGRGLADAMKAHLNQNGQKEVLYEGLTRTEKDFNALVTKIKAAEADVVYFGGLHTEAGPLIRQMREQGLNAAFVSGDGIVSDKLVSAAGGKSFIKGVYMTFGRDPRKLESGKSLVERFREGKDRYEPEGYTLYSYASVQAVAAAFRAVGPDGMKAAAWLKANPVDTVMGKKQWDQKGDLKESDYVMYQWDSNGKYAEVAP